MNPSRGDKWVAVIVAITVGALVMVGVAAVLAGNKQSANAMKCATDGMLHGYMSISGVGTTEACIDFKNHTWKEVP